MTKTMLIDAANSEEIRVCVLQNGKVEDFDFESASRKPVRGNIYLARVTRVEPSLQAAFVEFGGNRHGFLAFNEIHPDYYQVPISDRRVLQQAEAEEAAIAAALNLSEGGDDDRDLDEIAADVAAENARNAGDHADRAASSSSEAVDDSHSEHSERSTFAESAISEGGTSSDDPEPEAEEGYPEIIDAEPGDAANAGSSDHEEAISDDEDDDDEAEGAPRPARELTPLEEELSKLSRPQLIERYKEARRKRARLLRNYKIQEVIKRRQILLVQAVKEERGNKGAALTTYLSLAGRYCVLMPNTARGGGISRKIPLAADRKRLRRVVDSLDVPSGMGLIIRTAGAKRTKAEIKRDYEYLIRLWENIRTLTLKSIAPCLIYEEASLIKRAIRDLYDKDIDAILVEGDSGYREAKDFIKMLMPSHAKNVQPYKEKAPMFLKYGVEAQLDAMYRPTVRLKSGGYIVINQTEALIAIDVNSGKSTRERNIEQTALRTNLEAADEVARQCRLRDLAGLIVIDFIDMEESRNNRAVEKRLKDALRFDRARIQLGRISGFGLLELSRQRRRSGIVDGTTHLCPTCGGAGAVRSHEMAALRILRAVESEAVSGNAGNLQVKAALDVALYILNHKRDWLRRIESDYGVKVEMTADPAKAGDNFDIEKTGARVEVSSPVEIVRADTTDVIEPDSDEPPNSAESDFEVSVEAESRDREEQSGRRRRRRKRRKRDDETAEAEVSGSEIADLDDHETESAPIGGDEEHTAVGADGDERPRKRRRRGRRGGRRGRRPDDASPDGEESAVSAEPMGGAGEPDASREAIAVEENGLPEPQVIASDKDPEPRAINDRADDRPDTGRNQDEAANSTKESVAQPDLTEAPTPEPKPTRRGWWNRALGG